MPLSSGFDPARSEDLAKAYWTTRAAAIPPGKSASGFVIRSKLPPGPVRFLVRGDGELPSAVPDDTSDEPTPNCPGIYFDVPWVETFPTDLTTGPVTSNVIPAKIRIGRTEDSLYRWRLELRKNDPGKIRVTVMGSDNLDVTKIDLTSLQFGQGKAKPLISKIVSADQDRREDSDHDEDEKEWHHRAPKREFKNLQLEFKIADLGLKCNIDHALFLTGKVGNKDLFGGVKISPEMCKATLK